MKFEGRRIVVSIAVFACFALWSGCSSGAVSAGEDGTPVRVVDDGTGQRQTATASIVGGQSTTDFPTTVLLLNQNELLCTGTLIGKRTVLTAAHCTDAITGQPSVYFGSDFNNPSDPTHIATIKVVAYGPHPQWNAWTLSNDIAILKLASDAPIAPSPVMGSSITNATVGSALTLVGFGATSGFDATGPGKKRVTQTELDAFTATTISWQDNKHNTCYGDSGGPAFLMFGGMAVLTGVTSYGDQSCAFSGVDTRVDAFVNSFIVPTMATYGDVPTVFNATTGTTSSPSTDGGTDTNTETDGGVPNGPTADPESPVMADSCEGSCGGQAAAGCWCDAQCTKFGDCCGDRTLVCR